MNTQGMIPLKENDSKKISDRYQKKTYAKGATCIYGDTLYRAKADITTAEEWTAAHWEETNMETIRAEMAAEVSSLNANKDGTLSFSYYPTDSVKWCKVGNVVTISNLDDIQDIPAGGWNEIGTLPSDIRPRFTFVVRSSTNMNLAYRFYPSGVVTVYNYGNAVSGVINGSFFATYVT